jgi:hypothetical protein
MAKYSKKLVDKITGMIAADDYTIDEICKQCGIHRATYFEWKQDRPDFSDAIENAQQIRLEKFRAAARSGLMTLLNGKEFEEVTTLIVEGKVTAENPNPAPRVKHQKKVKKFILPNPVNVIFALKNLDKDYFSDSYILDRNSAAPLQGKSEGELIQLLAEITQKLALGPAATTDSGNQDSK